ncbi:MAG: Hsp20/alpha crystallin family protein [Bacteroidota bacterium]
MTARTEVVERDRWSSARFWRTPAADLAETPEAYLLLVQVPGADGKRLRVVLERERLTVTAPPASGSSGVPAARDTGRGRTFTREFLLGGDIRAEGMDASLSDGVLTIKLYKSEKARPREIAIQ